jgi:tetratricopeptide (TPR) repeat protein
MTHSFEKRRLSLIKKSSSVFVIFFLLCLSLFGFEEQKHTIEDYLASAPIEEYARYYFSLAIERWGEGNYESAQKYIDLAFEKPMYAIDISKLWYFLSKMEIEIGNVNEAIQSLENVIILQPDRTEILILLRSLRAIEEMADLNNPIIGLDYFSETLGFLNFVEFFYNPTSSERYMDAVYILDRANRFIYRESTQGTNVIPTPSKQPSAIVIDPISGFLYLSDLSDGTLYKMDIREGTFSAFRDGFSKPFVKAVDRAGNIYVLDPPRNTLSIITSTGTLLKHIFLSEGFTPNLVTDVDVDYDLIALQDFTLKAYRIVQIPSFEELYTIPFPQGKIPICSCFDGMGNIITLWNTGELTYRDVKTNSVDNAYKEIDLTSIILEGISDMDYNPPLLTFTDFDDHLVKSYVLLRENSEALNTIDGMYIEGDTMNIFFRNRHISGQDLQMNSPFVVINDSGGLVPFSFSYLWKPVRVVHVEDGKDFFETGFRTLRKNEFNIILWKYDGYEINFSSIAPSLLAKNTRLYILTNLSVSDSLSKLARLTGGMVLPTEYQTLLENYYASIRDMPFNFISYGMTIPFEGVKIVTVTTRIGGMDYSDSIYYANYMIPNVKESLINSLE